MYDLVSPVLFREKVFRHRLLKLKMQILFRHQEGPPTFHHQTCQALLSTEPDLQQIFRHVLPKMLVAERTLAERTQSLAALSRKMTQPRADSSLEPLQEDDRQLLTETMVSWANLDPPQHRRGRRDPQSSAQAALGFPALRSEPTGSKDGARGCREAEMKLKKSPCPAGSTAL